MVHSQLAPSQRHIELQITAFVMSENVKVSWRYSEYQGDTLPVGHNLILCSTVNSDSASKLNETWVDRSILSLNSSIKLYWETRGVVPFFWKTLQAPGTASDYVRPAWRRLAAKRGTRPPFRLSHPIGANRRIDFSLKNEKSCTTTTTFHNVWIYRKKRSRETSSWEALYSYCCIPLSGAYSRRVPVHLPPPRPPPSYLLKDLPAFTRRWTESFPPTFDPVPYSLEAQSTIYLRTISLEA